VAIVAHEPVAVAHADSVTFLADRRVVDHTPEPTARSVLDRVKAFGPEVVNPRHTSSSRHRRWRADPAKPSIISASRRHRRLAGAAVTIVLGVGFLTGTLALGDTLTARLRG
jgi:hypothetical protein